MRGQGCANQTLTGSTPVSGTENDEDHREGVPGKPERSERCPREDSRRRGREEESVAWEYADLFDVALQEPEEQLNMWVSVPPNIAVGRLGYRTRTTKAGPRLEIEIYPIWGREDTAKAKRAKKMNKTPARIQKANDERARHYATLLLDANFGKKDTVIHPTYSGPEPTYDNVLRHVRNFLNRVRRYRKKIGLTEPLKAFSVIEDIDDDKAVKRHVHMVISGGVDREKLEELWGFGFANADKLQPTERGLEALAEYITKQQKNRRRWCATKNLKKPKVRTNNTPMSNSRVMRITRNIENEAKEILQKLYPKYQYVDCKAHGSDVVPGVYVRAVMRRRGG